MHFFSALALAAALLPASTIAVPAADQSYSAAVVNADSSNTIKNNYIVVLKKSSSADARQKLKAFINSQVKNRNSKLNGVNATVSMTSLSGLAVQADSATLKEIQTNSAVDFIEVDQPVKATYISMFKPEDVESSIKSESLKPRFLITQKTGVSWGLYRISHRKITGLISNLINGVFSGLNGYVYDVVTGFGTRVYVIDSGVRIDHTQFNGRAIWGANFIAGSVNTDELGHGTHCAGTIAGTTYGVSKLATIVAVKVLDSTGSGTMSGVIQGIQWAVNDAIANGKTRRSVISMSLGGGYSAALNAAVQSAIAQGVTVVVAAGNNGADASSYSPASAPGAITVGATDSNDNKPYWSNYGSAVDIFAPGDYILSAGIGSTTDSLYMSGTSMATPHVAGLAAYLITKEGLGSPAAIFSRLSNIATSTTIGSAGTGSPNIVAYNGCGA